MSDNPDIEVCGVTWDDRDDSAIPYGHGYDCCLLWGHEGPHRFGDFTWEK